jgi:alpha-L-fucosidase 2
MRNLLLILALTVTTGLCGAAALDQQNVEYGRPNGTPLLLDVHVPDGPGPFPTAILVHGGGFDEGSKSTNVRPLFEPLTKAGYVWFSIDYRLAPKAHFTEAIEDVMTAIRFVRAHTYAYHVDQKRIVLIGESAGGYLVNYAGTHLPSDADIAAVVDFYGPSDYGVLATLRRDHPERFDMSSISRHAANGGGIHFFGVDQLDEAGLAKLHSMSPIAGVHKGMPPFLCIHGNKDDQVSFDQTPPFCDAIKAVGSNCEIITVEGGGHGMGRWKDPSMQYWKADMIAWLQKTL